MLDATCPLLTSGAPASGAQTHPLEALLQTKSAPTRHSVTSPPRAMPRPLRKLQCRRNLCIYE